MPVLSLGTVPSNFRRTSANYSSDEILICSTVIVCDVMEACVVARGMSRSHGSLRYRTRSPSNGIVWSNQRSPQLLTQKFARPPIGERCRRGIVVRPVMPRKGVTLTRIAVDRRVCFSRQGRFDLGLRRL